MVLAVGDNNLRGSLNVDSNSIGEVRVLNSGNGSLKFRVEGYFSQNSAFLARHNFVHGDLSALKPLDKGNFGAVADRDVEGVLSHLDVSLRVVDDALGDLVDNVLIEHSVHESVLARILYIELLSVEAINFHVFSSHSASLTNTNVSEQTCLLNGAEVTYEHIVVFAHLENAVGEGDGDCHGQAFGDGDDEHDKGNHNVVNQLLGEFGTANFFVDANLHKEHNHRRSKDNDGSNEGHELEASLDVAELDGEFSVFLTRVVGGILGSARGVLTDTADDSLAGASNDKGVSEQEGT